MLGPLRLHERGASVPWSKKRREKVWLGFGQKLGCNWSKDGHFVNQGLVYGFTGLDKFRVHPCFRKGRNFLVFQVVFEHSLCVLFRI